MQTITIRLDKQFFSAEVVARTCHRYSGRYFAVITTDDLGWQIELRAKDASEIETDLSQRFNNDALDDLLRMRISKETSGVAELLLTTALANSGAGTNEVP